MLDTQMSMPRSSLFPEVLCPLVGTTSRCPCPKSSLSPWASGEALAGPRAPSLNPWCAPPLRSLAGKGWGAAAAGPTVRRVTGRAAPPTAAATAGSSGPRGP